MGNNLSNGLYIEPYAGGAGLALFLLANKFVKKILLNDADLAIYSIWHSILNDTDKFICKIIKTDINLKEWYKQKEIIRFKNDTNLTNFDIGFAAFFLNRTNVSGIINGGPIGGIKQNSKYKIDCRFNKIDLIKRVEFIASMKNNMEISNLDAVEFIKKTKFPKKSLIYFDPPYYKKGSQLYRNFYIHEDHKKLCDVIRNIEIPWLLTYDNCQEILDLYKNYDNFKFSLRYSASLVKKTTGNELMFYGNIKNISEPVIISQGV